MIVEVLTVAVVGAVWAYAGLWLHELAHACAVVLLGGRIEGLKVWPRMAVYYSGLDGWGRRGVELAPLVAGLVTAPWLAVADVGAAAWLAWLVMFLAGGPREWFDRQHTQADGRISHSHEQ